MDELTKLVLKDTPQLTQRQDSLDDQLLDLISFADKLGMYDASDFLKHFLSRQNKNDKLLSGR